MSKVSIVGGGPAGLFCAYLLLEKGYAVDLYDHSSGLAKKFLVAGKGGLNLTHSEELEKFASRYTHNEELFKKLLQDFTPSDLRTFCEKLGVETFVGSSGRVFPNNLNAAEMLLNWQELLKSYPNFTLYKKHSMIGIASDRTLSLKAEDDVKKVSFDKLILALGGGSWKKTGSDAQWITPITKFGIEVSELRPMNCGFETDWSEFFLKDFERSHLKNIQLRFQDHLIRGEVMLTSYGIEGGAIYALSNFIRDHIESEGEAIVSLDLKPDLSIEEIEKRFEKKKSKESMTTFLKKSLKLDPLAVRLLFEVKEANMAKRIKNCEIKLTRTRPMDEAISTSGGVKFSELTDHFESNKIPGLFFCGEMLDFEAPTGGYLLQGCFSTAFRVCQAF